MTEDAALETPHSPAKAEAMTAPPNPIVKRSAYTLTAFFGALPFALWFAHLSAMIGSTELASLEGERAFGPIPIVVVATLLPALSAWFVFPAKTRAPSDMMAKGALVVAITMLVGPVLFMPFAAMAAPEDFGSLFGLLQFWWLCVLSGNAASGLSIWFIAIFLSLFHAAPLSPVATK